MRKETIKRILGHFIRNKIFYLPLIAAIIFSIVYLLRWMGRNPTIIGAPSYFHLAAAEKVGFTNFYLNPYHLLLSLNLAELPYVYLAIQLALTVASLLLLIGIMRKLKISSQHRFFFLLFLVLSPTFIYTSVIFNHYTFFIFLNLLGFNLLFQKKKAFRKISFPVFAAIPFFDLFSSLLTLSLLAVYWYFKKEKIAKQVGIVVLSLSVITAILKLLVWKISWKQVFLLGPYQAPNLLVDLLSDFGGLFGASLFILLLAIVGLIISWKKEKAYLAYFFALAFLAFYFYQTELFIYLNILIIFSASLGFVYFINRKWEIEAIKSATLFLLLLGVLFSTLICINNFSSLPPNLEIEDSLYYIKNHVSTVRQVFSHPEDSYFIEYFAQRLAFIHYHDPDFREKMKITTQIFESTYVKDTFPLLEQNNLNYIYISPKTKADLPTEQGLLFLFQNERFKRVYQQDDIIIQEFGRS